jgi:hypothetical protein
MRAWLGGLAPISNDKIWEPNTCTSVCWLYLSVSLGFEWDVLYFFFCIRCYPTDTTLHFNNDLCSRILNHRATVCWRSSDCAFNVNDICTRFCISFACRFRPFLLSKTFSCGLQIWRLTVNIGLQSGTADNGWASSSRARCWTNNSSS